MASFALAISYLEFLFPVSLAVPGVKPGFSNLVIVFLLCAYGACYAFPVLIVKVTLSALLFSGFSGFLFSLAGGLLSFGVMWVLTRCRIFSAVGISAAGGVFHNIGQLSVSALFTGSFSVFYYFPVLLLSGLVTGTVTGFLSLLLLKRFTHYEKHV